jgi:hypothetical protein
MTVLCFAPHAYAQDKLDNSADFVRAVLPYPIEFVHERVLAQFDSESRNYFEDYNRAIYDLPEKVLSYKYLSPDAYKKFMALPMVKSTKFYVFYGAYAVKQKKLAEITPLSVIGLDNPALVRYASLPPAAKAYDVYLWSPDSPYWYSEYTLNNKPLPFRTFFIIHLSPADEANTTVEVIEEQPVVRMGQKLTVDEHGKIQEYEVREVSPTTRDRRFLLSCIRQFIERDIPSRSKFNCKDEQAEKLKN